MVLMLMTVLVVVPRQLRGRVCLLAFAGLVLLTITAREELVWFLHSLMLILLERSFLL